MKPSSIFVCILTASHFAAALTISQINGHKFLTEYFNQTFTAIKGLVTAKGPRSVHFAFIFILYLQPKTGMLIPRSGFWIRQTTLDLDYRSSNCIHVFSRSAGKNLTTGDIITLDATVAECRSSPDYLYLTELTSPKSVKVVSKENKFSLIVIGEWLLKLPPTEKLSSWTNGMFSVFQITAVRSQQRTRACSPHLWSRLLGATDRRIGHCKGKHTKSCFQTQYLRG